MRRRYRRSSPAVIETHYLKCGALERAAKDRPPGYLQAVARLGVPVRSQQGVLLGWKLTDAQIVELKQQFNPSDVNGVLRHQANIERLQQHRLLRKLKGAALAAWFRQISEPGIPCEFSGCLEMRDALHAELGALGASCSNCQRSAVLRKYNELIKTLWLHHDDPESPPPLAAVLGSLADLSDVVVHHEPTGAFDEDAPPAWLPQE